LLGVDHNYFCINDESNYRFYNKAIHQENEMLRMEWKTSDTVFATAQVLLEKEIISLNCKTSKIYNCSSKSLLDMFEKVTFDKII